VASGSRPRRRCRRLDFVFPASPPPTCHPVLLHDLLVVRRGANNLLVYTRDTPHSCTPWLGCVPFASFTAALVTAAMRGPTNVQINKLVFIVNSIAI
jgi:hypothetical protein